jgi:ABC-type transporter MlaC component
MIQSRQGAKAVETYWNFDAMLDTIFGAAMKQQTDADRAEMRKLMLGMIAQAYSNPDLNDLLAKATIDGYVSRALPDNLVQIDFNVAIAPDKIIPNALYFREDSGQWHVIDAATNGKRMSEGIRNDYLKMQKTTTPLAYVRAMANGN